MSNAIQVTSGKDLADYLDGLPPVRRVEESLNVLRDKLKLILPQHVSVDSFIRMTIVSVGRNPYLAENIPSLLQAVATAAVLGLDPVSDTGQGHLVKYGGAVKFVPGYQGLIDVATRDGRCTNVEARIAFEDDEEFALHYGTNSRIVHRPNLDPEAAECDRIVRGSYAVFYFREGRPQFEWCPRSYLDHIAREALKKAGGKESKTQWFDPWNRLEMMRKTAVRKGSKFVRKSREMALVMALQEQDERGEAAALDGVDPEVAAMLDRIADAAGDAPRPPARGTVTRRDEVAAKLAAVPEPVEVPAPPAPLEEREIDAHLAPLSDDAAGDRAARGVLLCVDCREEYPKDDGHDCAETGESTVGEVVGRELVALAYEAADRDGESGPALVGVLCERYGVGSLASLSPDEASTVVAELKRATAAAPEPVGEAVGSHLAKLALEAAGGDQRAMADIIVTVCKSHGVETMAGLDKESAERVGRELEAAVEARREREANEAPKPNPANEPIGEEGAAALVGDLVKILEATDIHPSAVLERACKQVGAETAAGLKPSQANRARAEAKKMATAAARRAREKKGDGSLAPTADGNRITSALADEIDTAFNDSGLPDAEWDRIVRKIAGRPAPLNGLTNGEGRAVLAEIRSLSAVAAGTLAPDAERIGPMTIGKNEASRLFTLLLNVEGGGTRAKDEAERVCARFGVGRLEDLDPNDAARVEKELIARQERGRMRPR
jgi:phage RecT family recombinase